MEGYINFKYGKLNCATSEIRLIRVKPGTAGDLMNLELFHANLHGWPEYRALSYTWGAPYPDIPPEWDDPESKLPVLINGEIFRVRRNLESALRHFQQNWKGHLVLWIDAICINQDDNQERSSAIPKMGKIFENSQETIVWLGPNHHIASVGFRKINALSEYCEKLRLDWKRCPLAREGIAEHHKVLLEDFKEMDPLDQIKPVVWVMNCAWWHRVWVVQEVTVARSTIFICGNNAIPFSTLLEAIQQVNEQIPPICDAQETVEGSRLHRAKEQMSKVEGVLNNTQSLRTAYQRQGTSSLGLLDVLPALRSRFCSDARDKIYAALGVAQDGNIISPDYDQSLSQTYIDACRRLITKYQNLNIFAYCEPPSLQSSIPSWCPDWSSQTIADTRAPLFKRSLGVAVSISDHVYNASNGSSIAINFEEDSKILRVQAILVSFVDFKPERITSSSLLEFVQPLTWGSPRKEHSFIHGVTRYNWLHEWFAWLGESKTSCTNPPKMTISLLTMMPRADYWSFSPEADGEQFNQVLYTPLPRTFTEPFSNAYLRTICGDVCLNSEGEYGGRIGDNMRRCLQMGEYDWGWIHSRTLGGRTFIAGKEGLMGIGPEEVEIGDSIYIIMGSEVPIILRNQGNDTFMMVGECYLHGIMDGEILTSGMPYKVETIRIT